MLQIFAILRGTSVMNFGKNPQHDFPKMRGGGSTAVWNFSENSSVLDRGSFPNGLRKRFKKLWVPDLSYIIISKRGFSKFGSSPLSPITFLGLRASLTRCQVRRFKYFSPQAALIFTNQN